MRTASLFFLKVGEKGLVQKDGDLTCGGFCFKQYRRVVRNRHMQRVRDVRMLRPRDTTTVPILPRSSEQLMYSEIAKQAVQIAGEEKSRIPILSVMIRKMMLDKSVQKFRMNRISAESELNVCLSF